MLRPPRLAAVLALLALACAANPKPPAAGGATAWGFLGGAHPEFSVVYLDAPARPGERLTLEIRGDRFEPAFGALGAGGTITVRNSSHKTRVLANPFDDLLTRIVPGDSLELVVAEGGVRSFFLLDVRGGAEATVLVSPGPYSVVSSRGRFELRHLGPGRQRLHAWRPDRPPVFSWVRIQSDHVQARHVRRDAHHPREQPPPDQEAAHTAQEHEHQTLRQVKRNDTCPTRSQRSADRDFVAPAGGPREQQIRRIYARDEQQ